MVKLDCFEKRLNELEGRVNTKHAELTVEVAKKTPAEEVKILTDRIQKLELKLKNYHEAKFKNEVAKEAYSKRLNLLVHRLPERMDSAWETREETIQVFNEFMIEGLRIQDPSDVKIVDIHRLPQHPVFKNGIKQTRPVIIKLNSLFDKKTTFLCVKHLKSYNASQSATNVSIDHLRTRPTAIYVTDHLLAAFLPQRQRLLPFYKQAKLSKKKTPWRIVGNDYCLFIDGLKVADPAETNFD